VPTTNHTDQWLPHEGGQTIGQSGSEHGIILQDDEHGGGARITLERDCKIAPFAITCGIYGYMVHTRFFGLEDEAQSAFREMKIDLGRIIDLIPNKEDAERPEEAVHRAIHEFIERFP